MFRHCLATLLLFAYFAGQLAGTLHAHTHGAQSGTDGGKTAPHCHFGGHGEQSHSHSPSDHGHDHGHEHERQPAAPASHQGSSSAGHDSDAIYLSDQIGTPSLSSLGLVTPDVLQLFWLPAVCTAAVTSDFNIGVVNAGRNANHSATSCALYLTLRALRI
jgi:hypothetical protein